MAENIGSTDDGKGNFLSTLARSGLKRLSKHKDTLESRRQEEKDTVTKALKGTPADPANFDDSESSLTSGARSNGNVGALPTGSLSGDGHAAQFILQHDESMITIPTSAMMVLIECPCLGALSHAVYEGLRYAPFSKDPSSEYCILDRLLERIKEKQEMERVQWLQRLTEEKETERAQRHQKMTLEELDIDWIKSSKRLESSSSPRS
jgi:hypothetical protein